MKNSWLNRLLKKLNFKKKINPIINWYPELPSLNEIDYKLGDTFLVAFRNPNPYFGNDLLEAEITEIKDNKVRITWKNGWQAKRNPKEFVVLTYKFSI